jgi:hypothetical protein
MSRSMGLIGLVCLVALSASNAYAAVQWKIEDGGNGHWYEAFIVPEGITWSDARAAAIAAGGDLATITSPQENAFVFGVIDNGAYWTHPGGWYGPWLGGFQTPTDPVHVQNPAADWHWVTGEAWVYAPWSAYEPDDSSATEENRLFYDSPYNASTWAPT